MEKPQPRARTVNIAGTEVSQLVFGTEHINHFLPEFSGRLLCDAATQNNVFFWDTDNCYGSHPAVAAGLKMIPREKVVITSKTYYDSEQDVIKNVQKTLTDLDTPYLDFCMLHEVPQGWLNHKMPALKTLKRLKSEGLIRHIGLSTHVPDVAIEASDVEDIELIMVTFNKISSWIEHGDADAMAKALDYAHNKKGKGTCVIKVLARGDLAPDVRSALEFVLDYHECIDLYNIGVAGMRELRQNLMIINEYYDRLEGECANG